MSTDRISSRAGWVRESDLVKGPNGRNLCRWCGTEVPKGSRTFCSTKCVDEHKIRTDPGHVRRLLKQRDRGVCLFCGLDCLALERGYKQWSHAPIVGMRNWLVAGLREKRFSPYQSMWAADHIVPVVEGGGDCGLDNYRTLCVPCHKIVTAEWRRKKSKAKLLAHEVQDVERNL